VIGEAAVPRAWIFQANPDLYDIDRALESIDTIKWRVPQYTAEIRAGDVAALWRSGAEAGVIGVARVMGSPTQSAKDEQEDSFALAADSRDVTTRVELRVGAAQYVSKEEIADIPDMRGHQILVAPMGTVFPLSDAQWEALARVLPDPPDTQEPVGDVLPTVFAWEQRTKSIHPLPGGVDNYAEVIREVLAHVADTEPRREELKKWVASRYEVSDARSSHTVNFLGRISLLRDEGARVRVTGEGAHWLRSGDDAFLLMLIHGRVRFVGEMLATLVEPRSQDDLLEIANDQYAMGWSTPAQVSRRSYMLRGLRAAELTDDGRLVITDAGRSVLERLPGVVEPTSFVVAEEPVEEPDLPAEPAVVERMPTADETSELTRTLEETAHAAQSPDDFEIAVRDAFDFLGFDATWHGGAGKTDVLLSAELGPGERYRVIVDTKATSHAAVADQQIDWETLDEHRDRYQADYVAVVAPSFQGERVRSRARSRGRAVALIDVPTLTQVLRQHVAAPLGLDAYRSLFDVDRGPDEVVEAGEELRRQFTLCVRILGLVHALEPDEDAVEPVDLYWNLRDFEDQFGRATRDEIADTLDVLCQPPLALLRRSGEGFKTLGATDTVVRRLRLLADLIEAGESPSGE
jgi:hypothetical protein